MGSSNFENEHNMISSPIKRQYNIIIKIGKSCRYRVLKDDLIHFIKFYGKIIRTWVLAKAREQIQKHH